MVFGIHHSNIPLLSGLKQFLRETEAALQKCSCKKVFWKYTTNLQENTRFGCSTVTFLHLFRTPFTKNAYKGLLVGKVRKRLSPNEVNVNNRLYKLLQDILGKQKVVCHRVSNFIPWDSFKRISNETKLRLTVLSSLDSSSSQNNLYMINFCWDVQLRRGPSTV